jgi:Zn finger protein HypA/HybF involved in hydrogenase expression
MGTQYSAKCLDCGKTFAIRDGGGFFFHELRCNTCGKTKSVGFDALGEIHLRYLKGLKGPYSVVSSQHDAAVRNDPSIKPITEKEYHRKVKAFAGKCKCGGKYLFRAKVRCPKCRSVNFKKDEMYIINYD